MSWIGLRDSEDAIVIPEGLAARRPSLIGSDPNGLLPRGTVICELSYDAIGQTLRLFDDRTLTPWPATFSLTIGPHGTVTLTISQGDQVIRERLSTDLTNGDCGVVVSYAWDAPARSGVLSVYIPDRGKLFQTELTAPPPITLATATNLIQSTRAPGVVFVAISDEVEPNGPMPALTGTATLLTTKGPKLVRHVRPGDLVITADNHLAQVRWTGFCDLPARGRFMPLRVRAPYFGVIKDLFLAADQRLFFDGSEVEYLFGEESVLAAARHLVDHVSVLPAPGIRIMRYHHILLDHHAIISVSGAQMESFDARLLLDDPASRRHSVLHNVPTELLPRPGHLAQPLLKGFEAVTLTALRAA